MMIYICTAAVFNLIVIALTATMISGQLTNYENIDFGVEVAAIVVCSVLFCLSAYFVYSINELIVFHQRLLKTGSLTREWIGSVS